LRTGIERAGWTLCATRHSAWFPLGFRAWPGSCRVVSTLTVGVLTEYYASGWPESTLGSTLIRMDEQELEKRGESSEDGGGAPFEHTQANMAWTGGPPSTTALYSQIRRPYRYDIAGKKFWIGLAVVFVLLTVYLLATRQPTGHLVVMTVPDAKCNPEVSGYCLQNPLPYAEFTVSSADLDIHQMAFQSGADGVGQLDLAPGTYRVHPRGVGDLGGANGAAASVVQGQTVTVTITYYRP